MKDNNYFLPRKYNHQENMVPWDDSEHHNECYQLEVYLLALKILKQNPKWKSVIDIGCGSGYKLIKYFGDYETVGVDLPVAMKSLYKRYPDRDWREPSPCLFASCSPDILICSDAIEHIEEPDQFLLELLHLSTVKKFIISTPDRVLVRGPKDMGPPANPAHYREWTMAEFKQYLQCFFYIDFIGVIRESHGTICAVCSPKE